MKSKIFIPRDENFTFHPSETTFHTKVKDSCMMKNKRKGKNKVFRRNKTQEEFSYLVSGHFDPTTVCPEQVQVMLSY